MIGLSSFLKIQRTGSLIIFQKKFGKGSMILEKKLLEGVLEVFQKTIGGGP